MITSVHWSSCSAHYSFQILMNCLDRFSENTQNIKFHEKSVQWEPSCSAWAADRPEKANRFCNFANAPKKANVPF